MTTFTDTINGGDTADSYWIQKPNVLVYGNGGDDTLGADTMADHTALYGGTGADSLVSGASNTYLSGEDGNDILLSYGPTADSSHSSTLLGGAGDDSITSYQGHSLIDGGADNDSIIGYFGNNTFFGGTGDDTIVGETGHDSIDGGDGRDHLSVWFNGYDTITGGDGSDTISVGDGYAAPNGHNLLDGGGTAGDTISDVLDYSGFSYSGVRVDLNTHLTTYAYDTHVHDTVTGFEAVEGTNLNDTLIGAQDGSDLYGNDGNDLLQGGKGEDILYGGTGNDTLKGGASVDHLYGEDGNDSLDGGAGADWMYGGAGDDTYIVDNSDDATVENKDGGTDRVYASVDYTLDDNVENLTQTGNGNITGIGNELQNNLYGNSGNNLLEGMDGNDKIKGGAGDDVLVGGKGNDWLEGDAGADRFMFSAAADNGVDRIQDFVHGTDLLVFNAADYNDHAAFTTGTAAAGSGAQFVWDASSHILSYDHDGAGGDAQIAIALFVNGANVTASDIHFVA